MRILLCGNCQTDSLEVFLKRALPHHEYRRLPHLATFFGEFSEEKIAEDHAWADLVFYHTKHDHPQNYPTKQPKIPLSVWYNGSYFIRCASGDDWKEVEEVHSKLGLEAAAEFAVRDADMNYHERWRFCYEKMIRKEVEDHVPMDIRVSDLMPDCREVQQQLTHNHPTSIIFREWTNRICAFLGEKPGPGSVGYQEALANPNLGNLPCEESAVTAARKHLGLSWGGRDIDDESGRLCVREYFQQKEQQ